MLRVAVIGGGISGLATALALTRAGIDGDTRLDRNHEVDVYERSPHLREVGSGLTLWANATRVLRHLGVLEACLKRACPIDQFSLFQADGRRLMTIPIEHFGTAAVVMHRADLQNNLLAALPMTRVHTDSEVQAVVEQVDGAYLQIAGRNVGPFDVIVGADGLRSKARQFVTGAPASPRYRGYYIWRGVARLDLPSYARGQTSESWGAGHRFGVLPMGLGRVCWYATANQELISKTTPAARHGKLEQLFGHWHEPVKNLLAATPPGAILENPAYDLGLTRNWSRGGVVLVGDAAHAITPNLGQGACMALEDAVVLAAALKGITRPQVARALAQFAALRQERLYAMERRCRWLGAIGQWQQPWLCSLRNKIARHIPGSYFVHSSRAIQSYAAEQQLLPAVAV